jgi:hypothetical protein
MGIAFCPNGTPGMFAPDSEAEAKGMQYSDRVIKVGQFWVTNDDQIRGAAAAQPERPLVLVVARKKPKVDPADWPAANGHANGHADFDIIELSIVDDGAAE